MRNALAAYRVIAYVVGVWLLLLTFSMIMDYLVLHEKRFVPLVGPVHGFFYMVYFAISVWLGATVRWPLKRLVVVVLAGTIPFFSFVAERSVTREVRGRLAAARPTP